MATALSTKDRIRRETLSFVQRFGFNGFSLQDIADAVGIKKPSLFEHFKSKEEMGKEVIRNYREDFFKWTDSQESAPPAKRLAHLFSIFSAFAKDRAKVCPTTALAADFQTLTPALQKSLQEAFEAQLEWIEGNVKGAVKSGDFSATLKSEAHAEMLFSLVLGGQIVARLRGDPQVVARLKASYMSLLSPK